MGWTPDAFWLSTPAEFFLAAQGFRRQRESDIRIAAWHAANLMNVWIKEKVTPGQLLGEEAEVPVFMDADSFRAHMRERQRAREER